MMSQDKARLMQSLMEHEGWKEYDRSIREYVWNMTGAMDPQFLAGVKYALQSPAQFILAATEASRRTQSRANG